MGTPHKHAELIKAWADGAEIQFRPTIRAGWKDSPIPGWYKDYEYRVKPKPVIIRYRMILCKTNIDDFYLTFITHEQDKIPVSFIKFVSDWIEVEV